MTLCLFHFEHEFYKNINHESILLGHPFKTLEKASRKDILDKYSLDDTKKYISILPGSRESEINLIIEKALEMMQGNVELYTLTKDIRDNLRKEEILQIFEYMWSVVLADGKIDDFEAALMSKLVGLFHLTGKESADAKKKAMSHQ